jgi:CubicO group peptidase (beta-lactamase class C family)
MVNGPLNVLDKNSCSYQRRQAHLLAEGSTRPFQLDMVCAIASMTKLMTAVAALQCVEAGLITLDEDVAKYCLVLGSTGS